MAVFSLSNGVRVVCEHIPYVKSVCVGVWVAAGSRFESVQNNGYAHFIEHMLFKGTARRSARDLAEEMDFLGGHLNAFTTRETTCFYAKTLHSSLRDTIDILSDMLLNSSFNENDLELERGVILEEIAMYEDSPEDVAFDLLAKLVWNENPLGYLISGTPQSVKSATRHSLLEYKNKYYTAQNIVIAVAGCFDEYELVKLLEKYFSDLPQNNSVPKPPLPAFNTQNATIKKDIEQAHLVLGFRGVAHDSPDVYALSLFSTIFGGATGSRLFQEVREKQGLVYSIYTNVDHFSDCGLFSIYAACAAKNVTKVKNIILNEFNNVINNNISDKELLRAKAQTKSAFIMALESVSANMNAIGKAVISNEPLHSNDEILAKIDAVSASDVQHVITNIILPDHYSCAMVLPK